MTAAGAAPQVSTPVDSQIFEIIGRHRLMDELLLAGLEVAYPARDRGIDLIAYRDAGTGVTAFAACPIQMKATVGESFSIDRKYERFPGLLLAYVWDILDPAAAVTLALSYEEALHVATQMGYTESSSWTSQGSYTCTKIGSRLRELLEPHRMTPEKWQTKILSSAEAVRVNALQAGG